MPPSPLARRAALHYLLAAITLGIYGVQVCPFIEGLSRLQLGGPLAALVLLQYLLRRGLAEPLIVRAAPARRSARAFPLEWGLYLLSGLLLTLYNGLFHDFPPASGLKMVLGFATVGLFAAIDLTLVRERLLAAELHQRGESLEPDGRYLSLPLRFSLVAALSALFLVAIFFLVISKDLDWLHQVGDTIPAAQAQLSVLKEFAFIGALLLGYLLIAIRSFAHNLHHFLALQYQVLTEVGDGRLERRVPVGSNDEFGEIAHHTNRMIAALEERTDELALTRDLTIRALASLAETRDNETGAHILRTQYYVRALALQLRGHPRFAAALDEETIELLHKSAPLHDIGKVGIPDRILLKPGRLEPEEFEIMKGHAALGAEAIAVAERELGRSSFLRFAREIAGSHHEKWDGSGYPAGLAGDAIPLSGRLMAVADVYDALISKRVYKPAFPHEKAMEILREGRGGHFDPDLVDAFCAIEDEIRAIAARYADAHD